MARPIAEIVHDSAQGCWTLWTAAPAPALRGLVRGYQGYREASPAPVLRRELPSSTVPLILDFGEGFRIGLPGGAPALVRGGFLAGLHDAPVLAGSGGEAHCAQVDVSPLGAALLAGGLLGALGNRVLPLGEALGPEGPGFVAHLAALPHWAARFDALDAWLLRRFAASPAPPAWLGPHLAALARGGTPVAALAAQAGMGRQAYSARFRAALGLPPQRLGRVLRFERATARLRARPRDALAAVALDCGYADQAHFTREFTGFAGMSPTRFRARDLPDGTGLMES